VGLARVDQEAECCCGSCSGNSGVELASYEDWGAHVNACHGEGLRLDFVYSLGIGWQQRELSSGDMH
jgi:hypothetical protein